MIIKPYLPSDKQDCIAAFKSNIPQFFAQEELPDFEKWLDEQGVRDTTNKEEAYFVVSVNDRVIGCGGYHIDIKNADARMTWGLVHNSFHKRGIGKSLLLHRIAAIRVICPQCCIGLDTSQHSYPFFQKLGFVVTKITKDYYGKDLDRYDMKQAPTR